MAMNNHDKQSLSAPKSTKQPSKDSENTKRDAIANQVTATVEVIGGKLSPAALILFVEELESLPMETILMALQRCRRELKAEFGQTLTLKDVLDRAGVVSPEQMQAAAADLAWASVMDCFYQCSDCPEQHLSRSKQDKLMESGDARLKHAIRAVGGWRRLIDTDPKYQGPLRKDFVSAYSMFDAANEVQMQQLKGFSGKFLEDWNKMT